MGADVHTDLERFADECGADLMPGPKGYTHGWVKEMPNSSGYNDPMKPAAPVKTFVPKTLLSLFDDVRRVGGTVEQEPHKNVWHISLPYKAVGSGEVHQRVVGNVGYYVRDGKNRIGSNIHEIRRRIARTRPIKTD